MRDSVVQCSAQSHTARNVSQGVSPGKLVPAMELVTAAERTPRPARWLLRALYCVSCLWKADVSNLDLIPGMTDTAPRNTLIFSFASKYFSF